MGDNPEQRYITRICQAWGISEEAYVDAWGEWFNMYLGASSGWHAKPAATLELRFPQLHFVGFKGDEYARAIEIFGEPDFVHPVWDVRAQQEIAPNDRAIFANGVELKAPTTWSFNDSEK